MFDSLFFVFFEAEFFGWTLAHIHSTVLEIAKFYHTVFKVQPIHRKFQDEHRARIESFLSFFISELKRFKDLKIVSRRRGTF